MSQSSPSVVAIGVLDGVHAGHRALIDEVLSASREQGARPSVLTFWPHPSKLLRPDMAPDLIEPLEARVRRLEELGIEHVEVAGFDREFAGQSPEEFVEQILIARLNAARVVVGEGFVFGRKQSGKVEDLRRIGGKRFDVVAVAPVKVDGVVSSSTRIRQFVREGKIVAANKMLTRSYELSGEVIRGAGRGKTLGIPTLNLDTPYELQPALGVYASRAKIGDKLYDAITNVGYHPTFEQEGLKIETHLLDYSGEDFYGAGCRIEFYQRIRDERRFDGPDALVAQIQLDIAQARALLGQGPST